MERPKRRTLRAAESSIDRPYRDANLFIKLGKDRDGFELKYIDDNIGKSCKGKVGTVGG